MHSANHLTDEVQFILSNITFKKSNIRLEKFEVDVIELAEGADRNDYYEMDNYYIGFTVFMVRNTAPFVMKYYLPCAAIVLVSQISFLISPDQIPGRVALLVTLFLVLTNIFIRQQVVIQSFNHYHNYCC